MAGHLSRDTSSIAVAGAGRLGLSLAAALLRAGYPVACLASRDPSAAGQRVGVLEGRVPVIPLSQAAEAADVVFLTVPDAAIASVAAALPWHEGQSVVHCSGAHGLDILAAATRAGATAGCFHPLQTFPARYPEPDRFRGITVGVEGDGPLGAFLEGAAGAMGATTVRLEGIDRACYHAAAVFASNDVVALMAAASRAWEGAGLPADLARTALSPLLLAAATNIAAMPLAEALTGPVARGDVVTVARHLEALRTDPALAELYRGLARELLDLPLGQAPATTERLRAMLDANPSVERSNG